MATRKAARRATAARKEEKQTRATAARKVTVKKGKVTSRKDTATFHLSTVIARSVGDLDTRRYGVAFGTMVVVDERRAARLSAQYSTYIFLAVSKTKNFTQNKNNSNKSIRNIINTQTRRSNYVAQAPAT